MSYRAMKIIKTLDLLACKFEEEGDFKSASILDDVSQLLITASVNLMAPEISTLADVLSKYMPTLDAERALHLAARIYAEEACKEEDDKDEDKKEEDEESAEEKDAVFPVGALPNKPRREGPRKEDISIGTPEWWK